MSMAGLPRRPGRSLCDPGFTLIELLVVVAIIAILAALILPALIRARRSSLETKCMNNLSQFYKALVMYDQDHDHLFENYPERLTYLYTGTVTNQGDRYAKDPRLFQCPLDSTYGHEGGKPVGSASQYKETDEGPGLGSAGDPKCSSSAPWCSYLYEFSGAKCVSWGPTPNSEDFNSDGVISWAESKFRQLNYGDDGTGDGSGGSGLKCYPRTWFPIMRCFWHSQAPDSELYQDVFNLAIDGNFFKSGPKWENCAIQNNPALMK